MKKTHAIALAAVTALVSACASGSTNAKPDLTPKSSNETVKKMPDWFTELPPADENYMYAAATETSRSMQTALDKARLAARNDIAQQLEARMNVLGKRFVEETGVADSSEYLDQFVNTTKVVVSTTLVGSRTRKQEVMADGAIYRSYVLMEMPLGATKAALLDKIKQQKNMYTRFRASESFKELEEEVRKLEESKKQQVPD